MTRNHTWVRRTELAQVEAKRVELRRSRRRRVQGGVRSVLDRMAQWFRRLGRAFREIVESVGRALVAALPLLEPVATDLLRERLAEDLARLRDRRVAALAFSPEITLPTLPALTLTSWQLPALAITQEAAES